jgi:iron complex outermembrane receptor protein
VTNPQQKSIESEKSLFTPVFNPLTAAVIAALIPVTGTMAQEADGADEPLEEIVTTGSRIRKDTFSSAAPMDVVLTEGASARGINDVATMLQTTTIAAGAPQVTAASSAINVTDGGLGTQTISMRGLGANRTLVLLNGRRAGPSGVQGSVSAFDLNAIPLSSVERVEVLKDGASSIYGSDAVAGVINIITKKDEGGSFEAFLSQPNTSGGEHTAISGSWGKNFERGYFRATANYNKTEILQRRDRDFFNCEEDYTFDPDTGERADLIDPRTGSYLCNDLPWGHVWVYDYAEYVGGAGDGTTNVGPPTYLLQYDFDGLLSANGLSPLAAPTNPNHMTTPEGWYPIRQGDPLSDSLYDAQHPLHGTQTLIPESEVMTLFLEGEYELSDNVTAYTEFLLNRRETENIGYRQIWSYIYNYDSADLGWGSDPLSVGWTGAQWLSPLSITEHADQTVTVDYSRVVLGLLGENENFLAGWNWDLSFQYSKSDGEYLTDEIVTDALEYTWFSTSGSCVGEFTSISNRACVDIPWLDPNFLAGDIPLDVQEFLYAVDKGTTEYTQMSVEGFMTGDIFEMPAGTAAMAIGFHYREDEILDTPGALTLDGNNWLNGSAGITSGDDTTRAVFGEIDLPLLQGKPLAEYVDFNASVRYTDVESYGGDTTYKVGLNWALTDTFRARSTFGTSFRTPALYELYLANQSSSLSARQADPCINWASNLALGNISDRTAQNCEADGIPSDHIASVGPSVLTGGGFGVLKAETSEAFTFGLVWRPEFADLSISVDYFDILVEDEVDKIGGQSIVAGCYASVFFPDEPLCDQFDRASSTAPLPNAILTIRDSFINVSKQQIKGMDVAAQWSQELPGRWGNLTVDTQWTFSKEDIVGLFDNTEEDLSGLAGHPETVGNVNLTLNMEQWAFFWGMNYIGETDNSAHFGRDTVTNSLGNQVAVKLVAESVLYHSLSASYDFDNGVVARAGMANVTDQKPPRMTSQGTGNEVSILGQSAFYSQYDWLGRRIFLNLTMGF